MSPNDKSETGERIYQFRIGPMIRELTASQLGKEGVEAYEQAEAEQAEGAVRLSEAAAAGDFDTVMTLLYRWYDNNARLEWLVDQHESLSANMLRPLLVDLWTAPNMALGGPQGFTSDEARAMFAKTGFVSDGPGRPEVPTVLYHGIWFETEDDQPDIEMWDGMCWTTELSVAKKFAHHGLWSGVVTNADDVLARFDGRDEHEWVVHPENLTEVTRLD